MRRFMVKILDDDNNTLNTLFVDAESLDILRRDLIRVVFHELITIVIFCLKDSRYIP